MDGGGDRSNPERDEDDDAISGVLVDRFRLSSISVAETEAKKNGMIIAETAVACIADLAFRYAERLAKDLELFSQHAGRKSVNMDDVMISTHRNEHLAALLRPFYDDLKAKEPQSERKRKRKKGPKTEEKASNSETRTADN